jgi:hypothetical protein
MNEHKLSYLNSLCSTLLLVGIFLGLHYLPLPFTWDLLMKNGYGQDLNPPWTNILVLGWKAFFNSFLVVEIFSLILKPLRIWRVEGIAGREKLNRCAWVLGFIFAFINALGTVFSIWSEFKKSGLEPPFSSILLFELLIVPALMAGACFSYWIAQAITRVGVGNGFLILLLSSRLEYLFFNTSKRVSHFRASNPDGNHVFSLIMVAVLFGLGALFLWRSIQRAPRIPIKRPDGKRIWYEISPFPPSGDMHFWVFKCFAVLALFVASTRSLHYWLTGGLVHIVLETLLMIPFGLLFYNLLWSEKDIFGLSVEGLTASIRKREKILEGQFWKAMILLLVGNLLFAMPFDNYYFWPAWNIVTFDALIYIFAISQDLWAQWLFWKDNGRGVELLEMDNVHLASYVKGMLVSEGLPCYIQGYHFRRLHFIFTPLYKMRLLVPESDETRARALLAQVKYQVV